MWSPVSAGVNADVHVLIVKQTLVSQLMGSYPHFTRDMNIFIEERQRLLESTLGIEVFAEQGEHREMVQLIAGMTLPDYAEGWDDEGSE